MEIYLPFPKSLISQKFGANANVSYARDGLKGHTAYDWGAPWGTSIPNCVKDAYCYSVMHKDNPDPAQYRAVFTLVEDDTGVYEVSYGHCSAIYAVPGITYQVGDTLALVGNTGDVFSGDHEVTAAERIAGSHAGAHLHGPQIRPVKKVTEYDQTKQYLFDSNGPYQKDGLYYQVLDYNNGYNGCVSFAPFSTEVVASKTSVDLDKVQVVVDGVSKATEALKTVPEPERIPFIQRLQLILSALTNLFKS